jgi:8-oxo-dGTP diphosphatase
MNIAGEKKHIRVVCAIIEHNGRMYLGRRKNGVHAGFWEFPGGKIQPGENDRDAIFREISEELCVDVNVGRKLNAVMHDYPEFSIELIPFLCTVRQGTITPVDHDETGWFTPKEIIEQRIALLPPDAAVFDQVKLHLIAK